MVLGQLPSTFPPPKLEALPSGLGPPPVDTTSYMSLGPVAIASSSGTRSTIDGVLAGSSPGNTAWINHRRFDGICRVCTSVQNRILGVPEPIS